MTSYTGARERGNRGQTEIPVGDRGNLEAHALRVGQDIHTRAPLCGRIKSHICRQAKEIGLRLNPLFRDRK